MMTIALAQAHLRRIHPLLLIAALLTTAFLVLLAADPPSAHALLKNAANRSVSREAGAVPDDADTKTTYTQLTAYFDTIAGYATWVAIPAASLGCITAGGMFMAGNRRAGNVAISTVVGLGVVVSAKAIAS